MTVLGADDVELDRLADRLRGASGSLHRTRATITAEIRRVAWLGPDAEAFRSRWTGTHAVRLQSIAERLQTAGELVAKQAEQQRRASEGGDVALPGPGPNVDVEPPDPAPPSPPPESLPPDRVVRTELVRGEIAVGVSAIQGKAEVAFLIEYLANGQVRVTEVVGVHGGVGVDTGARAHLDLGEAELRSGAMAGASALAGLRFGRTWEVPQDELDELAVAVALEKIDPGYTAREVADGGAGFLDSVTPDDIGPLDVPFDEANDALSPYLEYRLPEPIRQGVDVVGSGEAYAMLGLNYVQSADLRAQLEIAVGAFVEDDGDIGLRYEHSGKFDAQWDNPLQMVIDDLPLPSADFGVSGRQSVELLFGSDGTPEQIVIEQQYGVGDNQTLQTVTIDVDPRFVDDARTLAEALGNPTPENIEALQGIDPSQWGDVSYTEADLSVDGENYGAGAGIGIDPYQGSLDVKFETESVEYDYGN